MASPVSDRMSRERPERRRPIEEPVGAPGPGSWLSLTDDELLHRIESLDAAHDQDLRLLEVVRSSRHFFVRQEAAKRIVDGHLLKEHSHDRHIGQILVRAMNRHDDLAYLERLVRETRHLEVRKAAEVQLERLRARFTPAPE